MNFLFHFSPQGRRDGMEVGCWRLEGLDELDDVMFGSEDRCLGICTLYVLYA